MSSAAVLEYGEGQVGSKGSVDIGGTNTKVSKVIRVRVFPALFGIHLDVFLHFLMRSLCQRETSEGVDAPDLGHGVTTQVVHMNIQDFSFGVFHSVVDGSLEHACEDAKNFGSPSRRPIRLFCFTLSEQFVPKALLE